MNEKKLTLRELERYCTEQAFHCIAKAVSNNENAPINRYYAGRANAFLWIAGCIQNDTLEYKPYETDERL